MRNVKLVRLPWSGKNIRKEVMSGTEILNKLEELREYVKRLEDDIEYREEELENDKKKLEEAKQRIEQLENQAKNYWRKND